MGRRVSDCTAKLQFEPLICRLIITAAERLVSQAMGKEGRETTQDWTPFVYRYHSGDPTSVEVSFIPPNTKAQAPCMYYKDSSERWRRLWSRS